MNQDEINAKLHELIAAQRERTFLPEYRAAQPEEAVLGVMLSNYFRWTPKNVLQTCLFGLEDSNAHTMMAKIEALTGVKAYPEVEA